MNIPVNCLENHKTATRTGSLGLCTAGNLTKKHQSTWE